MVAACAWRGTSEPQPPAPGATLSATRSFYQLLAIVVVIIVIIVVISMLVELLVDKLLAVLLYLPDVVPVQISHDCGLHIKMYAGVPHRPASGITRDGVFLGGIGAALLG